MKKRILAVSLTLIMAIGLMVIPGVGSFKAVAAQTFEKVDFINGVVIADKLNLRSGPSTQHEIIGKFTKNKWLNVLAKIGDWYAVFDPETGKVGCVSGAYFKSGAEFDQGSTGKTNAPAPSKPALPSPVPAPAPTTTPTPTGTPAPSTDKPTGEISQDEQKLLDLINQERAKSKLSPLVADPELMKVARIKANDMTKNNYFSHYSPTYGSPFDMMRQFGITFKAAAENIAGNSTVEGAVSSWMKSEGHRNNIMNSNYNYTGIGISKSNKYGYVFVQMFIRK